MGYFNNLWQSLWGFEKWIDNEGQTDFFTFDPGADFSDLSSDKKKIVAVFTNPAVLKVFKLQCDMFSLGKIYVYQNDKEKINDPVLKLFNNPNPFQIQEQLMWDYMFWKMIGNAYCYVDSDNSQSESNKIYFLDPSKITFPEKLKSYKDKIVLSDSLLNEIKNSEIIYTYDDGSSIKIKWDRITHISDLSNGVGNWFKGRSTIDALYEIICNSRESVRSKNVNVRYSGKFMVAGKTNPDDTSRLPLSNSEKESIEINANNYKTVTAVKSMVDIKRYVENASIVSQLDDSYLSDYFKIGLEFGIPKEVLDASLSGSTYENQEKARGAHVDYTLSPSAQLFFNAISKRFGYTTKKIIMSWDHLSFMQAFEKDRATTLKLKSETLINLMKAGVNINEINTILDTNFTELDYVAAQKTNSQTGPSNQNSANN